jgi:ribosomal protein S18 acetylase RimI-like enzyme
MNYELREFSPQDAAAVDRIALTAFEEYRLAYSDWPAFSRAVGNMSSLAASGEIIVAAHHEQMLGAVVYIGPGRPKSAIFKTEWPVIRMLVVDPAFRSHGIGRALTEECISRARRDNAPVIALHTTSLMTVALPMYKRMGFILQYDAPPIYGVPYGVYLKQLRN